MELLGSQWRIEGRHRKLVRRGEKFTKQPMELLGRGENLLGGHRITRESMELEGSHRNLMERGEKFTNEPMELEGSHREQKRGVKNLPGRGEKFTKIACKELL